MHYLENTFLVSVCRAFAISVTCVCSIIITMSFEVCEKVNNWQLARRESRLYEILLEYNLTSTDLFAMSVLCFVIKLPWNNFPIKHSSMCGVTNWIKTNWLSVGKYVFLIILIRVLYYISLGWRNYY